MRRYLVVANQTLGGARLREKVRACAEAGPCSFHVVVPATHPRDQAVWTEGEARELARERLDIAMEWLRGTGAEVTGSTGVERPMLAIGDAMLEREFDEIIVSTLPAGASRWLKQDLPHRVERRFGIPVTHIEGERDVSLRSA